MGFLKNLFNSETERTGLVFIVEDNPIYAKTLEGFLKANVPAVKEIKLFPVGETCLMELHKQPDVVIMDYFLDSKYYDAETGLDNIKKIRDQFPEMNIIVLSAQEEIGVVIESIKKYNCSYIKKNPDALETLKTLMNEIYK